MNQWIAAAPLLLMHPDDQKLFETWIGVPTGCLLVVGVALLFWAADFPIVWRQSMLANAPTALCGIALVTALVFTVSYINWLARRLGVRPNVGLIVCVGATLVFGWFSCLTQLGLIINGALDRNPAQVYHSRVVFKRAGQIWKGGINRRYYACVQDWRNPNRTVQLEVSRWRYQELSAGDSAQVTTRAGVFSWEWVVDYSVG